MYEEVLNIIETLKIKDISLWEQYLKKISFIIGSYYNKETFNNEVALELITNSKVLNNIFNYINDNNLLKSNEKFSNIIDNDYIVLTLISVYLNKSNIDTIDDFIDSKSKQRLTSDEERDLIIKYKEYNDINARNKLLLSYDKLVKWCASKWCRHHISNFEDACQDGQLGLMMAIDRFDYSNGVKFITYATWWIKVYIKRGANSIDRFVKIPMDEFIKIYHFREQYFNLYGTLPSNEEIAKELGITVERIFDILYMSKLPISIDKKINDDENDSDTIGDFILDENVSIEDDVISRATGANLYEILEKYLTPQELKIISLRYGFYDDKIYSLEEVGKIVELPKARVRKIEIKILRKLRFFLQNDPLVKDSINTMTI